MYDEFAGDEPMPAGSRGNCYCCGSFFCRCHLQHCDVCKRCLTCCACTARNFRSYQPKDMRAINTSDREIDKKITRQDRELLKGMLIRW